MKEAILMIPIMWLFYSSDKISFDFSNDEIRELIIAIESYPPDSIVFQNTTIVKKRDGNSDQYIMEATAVALQSLGNELRENEEMQKHQTKSKELIMTIENYGLNCSIR